ncbi:MAG TPA: GDP-fucose synthetase [Blastocatellia bacterium]|jgi:GDP-L-fucose synthase|nr:GDP-fucose synthetase [Blastocatellia bacterium]
MEEFNESFPYKRVVITGGAGFLGRFIVARLQAQKDVEIFVPRRAEYDLVEAADIKRLLAATRPDLIIHLAAVVGGIGANQKNPGKFFYDNLMMGTQLIEQSRLYGVAKFVALGTVCAYPKFTPTPFREDDLWNGYPEETNAPYGLAKKMMLVQAQGYRQQYDFNTIFLLPANLYGPGDNFDLESSHVIPALIRKCLEAREKGAAFVEAWGTGNASREFLYVDDCAEGVLRAAALYDESEPVNLGTGSEIKISELLQLIARLTRFKGEIRWQTDRPDGQPRRRLDVSRALEKFGFRAQVPLEEGLRRTVEWYETTRAVRSTGEESSRGNEQELQGSLPS